MRKTFITGEFLSRKATEGEDDGTPSREASASLPGKVTRHLGRHSVLLRDDMKARITNAICEEEVAFGSWVMLIKAHTRKRDATNSEFINWSKAPVRSPTLGSDVLAGHGWSPLQFAAFANTVLHSTAKTAVAAATASFSKYTGKDTADLLRIATALDIASVPVVERRDAFELPVEENKSTDEAEDGTQPFPATKRTYRQRIASFMRHKKVRYAPVDSRYSELFPTCPFVCGSFASQVSSTSVPHHIHRCLLHQYRTIFECYSN